MDRDLRRRQVLAACHERTQEPRHRRYSHCCGRRAEGLSRGDQRRLSRHRGADLHRASDPPFHGVRLLERPQGHRRRTADRLSRQGRRSRRGGAQRVRCRPVGAQISRDRPSWRRNWAQVIPFFAFPVAVRRIIYTTNAIEALNAKLRRAVKTRGHFPTDEAAIKLLYLVLRDVIAEWKMPPREWCEAKTQFAIMFDGRFVTA